MLEVNVTSFLYSFCNAKLNAIRNFILYAKLYFKIHETLFYNTRNFILYTKNLKNFSFCNVKHYFLPFSRNFLNMNETNETLIQYNDDETVNVPFGRVAEWYISKHP